MSNAAIVWNLLKSILLVQFIISECVKFIKPTYYSFSFQSENIKDFLRDNYIQWKFFLERPLWCGVN